MNNHTYLHPVVVCTNVQNSITHGFGLQKTVAFKLRFKKYIVLIITCFMS